jgi:hypothetical protein
MHESSADWDQWLAKLKMFREQFGHSRVPSNWPGDRTLAKWVAKQRNELHRLSFGQFEILRKLGFDFGSERYWVSRFLQLAEFKRVHGHCNVPVNWTPDPQLGRWLSGQRLRKASLPVSRRKLFDAVGIDWAPLKTAWNRRYEELRAFKEIHGHCRVAADWPENPELALWVANQRRRRRGLDGLEKRLLKRIGFDWAPGETIWAKHVRELKAFKRRHGHCNVPARWPESPSLATWVATLRDRGKKRTPRRWRRQLCDLDFEWETAREQWWETHFAELESFKKGYGHCNVPKEWEENPALGNWVSTQRTQRSEMSSERRQRLNRLGFVWQLIPMSPRKTWEDRFQELLAFKKRFNHIDVPSVWRSNQALSEWVKRQRGRDRVKLTPEQKRRLVEIDFCWEKRESSWEQRFEQLATFFKRFGNADVPKNWSENPALGRWVLHQRYRKNTLSSERIAKLDDLRFRWPATVGC